MGCWFIGFASFLPDWRSNAYITSGNGCYNSFR